MKRTVQFIINPISGTRQQIKERLPRLIRNKLDNKQFEISISFTERKGHACEITRRAVENGIDIIVAVGGDGTINEVARELLNTPTALCIIPLGSGNGFARHLGYPLRKKKIFEVLNTGEITDIDVCRHGHDIFCSVMGIGFDAYVAQLFADAPTRGLWSYAKHTFTAFFRFKCFRYTLTTSEDQRTGSAFFISLFNTNQYGYNVKLAREASLQDGKMDIWILHPFPKWKGPWLFMCVLFGIHKKLRYFEYLQSGEISIKTDTPVHIQLDGDPAEKNTSIHASVAHNSLKVLVP